MLLFGKKDLFIISHVIGKLMQYIAVVILVPIIISIIYSENIHLAFILPALFSFICGVIILFLTPDKDYSIRLKHGMIISVFAWFWAAFIGSFAMILALNIDFINAFFENISAWTGSGLTIFSDIESLPKSILFLRSIEQWIGGVGVVVMVIGILIRPGTMASRLYKSEARDERIKPSIVNTVRTIILIYAMYTILSIILYGLAGMPLFDAINNALLIIATGGMGITNNGLGSYNSDLITIISIFIMIIGGTSFLVHYKVLKGKFNILFKDIQFQVAIVFILMFSIIMILTSDLLPLESIFNLVSALTSTGISLQTSNDVFNWYPHVKVLIIFCMLMGMSAGSTSGGIKLLRVITVVKSVIWDIKKTLFPEGTVIPHKISNKTVTDLEIREAGVFITIYLTIILISWFVFLFHDYDPLNSFFEISSAMGNNGFSMGLTDYNMPIIPKLTLILCMFLGRLEILPIFVLFATIIEFFKIPFNQNKK